MAGNLEIVQVTSRGSGMTMYSAQQLIQWVMNNPGQVVYTNFDLPKGLIEIVEKYATIEKVKPPEDLKGLWPYRKTNAKHKVD